MKEALRILVLVITFLLMLVGVVGTVLPVIPGPVLIFGAALLYAVVEGFRTVGWPTIAVLGILAAVAATADIWVSSVGAKMGGASIWSVLTGLVGGAVGLVLFTLPGAILGAVLGVLLAEIVRVRDWRQALKAGSGWAIGWALSTVLQLGIGLIMVVIFVWQLVRGV